MAGESGAFWRGADGNVWVAGNRGTNSAGKWDANTYKYWSDRGYRLIVDPVNPPAPPSSGRSGSSAPAPAPQLNQAAVDATRQSLDSLGTILAQALASAQTGYDNANRQLDLQEQQQRAQYDESTLNNMKNYDSNLAASLRAGRSGLSGLMAALRGGGGSGNQFAKDWVQNTVADTTSNDIREGYTTYDENRGELDKSLSTFLTDLRGKRQQNEDTFINNQRAARLYDAEQRQNLFQKLASLYSEAGRNNDAASYLSQAGAQAPIIAENMGSRVSSYDTSPINVKSADITAFSAPQEQSITATDERRDGGGSGIFSLTDPRRRERRAELAGV